MTLKILQSAASEPGPGKAFRDPDYQLTDRRRPDKLIEVRVGGTPTFTLQVEQSLDGHVWHAVGDAITAAGLHERTVKAPYFRAGLTAIEGGAVTVFSG
jgi:hypothetical protein